MSKFTLPFGKAANKPIPGLPDVDVSALEAFAAGARVLNIESGLADPVRPAWASLDPNGPPKNSLSIRVNDYHLAMIRHLVETQDTTQNRLLRRLLLPEIEALAIGTARQEHPE